MASFPVIEAGWRPLSFRRPEDNGRSLLGAVHAASNGGRRGEKKGVGGGPSGRCLPTPLFSPAPEVLPVSEHGQENLQNPLPAGPKEQKENIFSFRRRSRRNEKSSSCRTTACSCPTTGRGRFQRPSQPQPGRLRPGPPGSRRFWDTPHIWDKLDRIFQLWYNWRSY